RKNPSGRGRIIYLTSESGIRYGHHDQDQRRRSSGRCRLSCPSVRDKDRPLGGFGEGGFAERLAQKVIKRKDLGIDRRNYLDGEIVRRHDTDLEAGKLGARPSNRVFEGSI